jgi:hypothetical protein
MAQILPHILNACSLNRVHGNRMLENMRVALMLRDACPLAVLMYDPLKLPSSKRKKPSHRPQGWTQNR